jgi:hypothetical protein
MPAPCSYDLRQKAIEAVKGGERRTDVCQMLNLSRNMLDLCPGVADLKYEIF